MSQYHLNHPWFPMSWFIMESLQTSMAAKNEMYLLIVLSYSNSCSRSTFFLVLMNMIELINLIIQIGIEQLDYNYYLFWLIDNNLWL